jgi:hypothetical protein
MQQMRGGDYQGGLLIVTATPQWRQDESETFDHQPTFLAEEHV